MGLLLSSKYDFLRNDPRLGANIILLGLGGSRAYGIDTPDSDWDIRGCALNSKEEILSGDKFDVVTDSATDTTVYSFGKLVSLLAKANPNTIELLGLNKDQYFYIPPIGQELLDNKELFLSQEAYYSFAGYATAQLRRLSNKAARTESQREQEEHILGSVMNAEHSFRDKYFNYPEDSIRLYTDVSDREEYDSEIFMDISLKHYPLRDYKCMWSEMSNIVKDYSKLGKRNKNAVEHDKLGKHMCHLIRLYLMGMDILEHGEVITYRGKDLPLLRSIRDGAYLDMTGQPKPEFFNLVDHFEARLRYAKEHSDLPKKPDYEKIRKFVINVNERVVKEEI